MERITIKSLTIKRGENDKGQWVNTQITPTEGRKWTGFSDGLASLKEGDVIEITEYEEGTGSRYNKILKYNKVESAVGGKGATERVNGNGEGPEKRASIETQKAAELAIIAYVGLHQATLPEVVAEKLIADFEKSLDWIDMKLSVALQQPTTAKAKRTELPLGKVSGDIPDFANGVELVNYALKHGYTIDKIKSALGMEKPVDIKDLKAATAVLFGKTEDLNDPEGLFTGQ